MKKVFAIAFFAMIFVFAYSPKSYAVSGGLIGGANFYSGNDFDAGTYIGAYVDIDLAPMLDLRLQATHSETDSNIDYKGHGEYTLKSNVVSSMLKFNAPVPLVSLYAAAGLAYHMNDIEADYFSEDDNHVGFIAQAGIGYSLLLVNLNLTANYSQNSVGGDDFGSFGIGLSAGFSF